MRYFLGFLVAIGLIILILVLMFSGGGKPKVPSTAKSLESYATTDAAVSMYLDGPINANQDHQAVKITVDRNSVTFDKFSGYQGDVTQEQTFNNNETSYFNFLRALEFSGFTHGNTDSSLSDERGRCPLSERMVFELNDGDNRLEHFWTTSCGGTKTYQGNTAATIQLFERQVPGYSKLTSSLSL